MMSTKIVIDNVSGSLAVDGSTRTFPASQAEGATLISNSSNEWVSQAVPTSWRNRLINGDMAVSQRNGDTFVSPTSSGVYTVDRWRAAQNIDSSSNSVYFDGSGDYLSVGDAAALEIGSGDFTIESWIYVNALNPIKDAWGYSYYVIASKNLSTYGFFIGQGPGAPSWDRLFFHLRDASTNWYSAAATYSFQLNSWYHVAVSRQSGTLRFFVNGELIGTQSFAYTAENNTSALMIGGTAINSSYFFSGYISNLRLIVGTALYTANFTPSIAPLTAVAGTSLLTCASTTLRDLSTNNFTITAAGNAAVSVAQPFGNAWSNYFDGTGDYLQTPDATSGGALQLGTSDFTIECWVNAGAQSSYARVVDACVYNNPNYSWGINSNASGATADAAFSIYTGTSSSSAFLSLPNVFNNTWNHIAVVRIANTVYGYVNGSLVNTSSIAVAGQNLNYVTPIVIGAAKNGAVYNSYFTGYISNLRIVKGTALYTANFTPPSRSTPLTAVANTSLLTCASNRFQDLSTNNFTLTPTGNVAVSLASPITGNKLTATAGRETGYSNYFDGNGDYLSIANNAGWNFGSGNFTIECWIYTVGTGGAERVFAAWNNPANAAAPFCLTVGGGTGVQFGISSTGSDYISINGSVARNTWAHIAIVRNGSTLSMYVNGTLSESITTSVSILTPNAPLIIGGRNNNGTYIEFFNGYISNLRIVKGTALYTANFTPSTTPLVPVTSTSLLTCASSTFADKSSNNFTVTAAGNAAISAINPFTQAGFGRSLRWAVSTPGAPISTNQALIQQRIEGSNIYDFSWGTPGARAATLSFWVNSPIAGTYCAAIQNSALNRSYVAEYTVSAANTWERKTVNIPGPTSGFWSTDNSEGLRVCFDMGSGTNYNTTAGAWQVGNFTRTSGALSFSAQALVSSSLSNNFYVTGVQLELGSVATPYEMITYGKQLELCQRYYNIIKPDPGHTLAGFGVACANSATNALGIIYFPQAMRTAPTIGQYFTWLHDSAGRALASPFIWAAGVGSHSAYIYFYSSGLTAGRTYLWTANNTDTAYVTLDADL